MLDKIIKFSLENRRIVLLFSIIILIYGIIVTNKLPVDVFPNLNRPTVTIMAESHGLAPEEVESLVTFPIEVAINGTPGIKRIRSSSGVGLSIVWMEFEWGTDIYRNRQLVSERLSLLADQLPKGVTPVMGPITSIMGEIQLIGLSSSNKKIKGPDLRSIADWIIRPRLLSISGISQVIPIGGGVKQYQILLDSQKIRNMNLSIEEVDQNLKHISENSTGGFVSIDNKEYLIRNLGRVENIVDIEESIVGVFRGEAVKVKDIAEVKIGKQVMRGDASIDGQEGVILAVKKQPGSSTLKLTSKISDALNEIEKSLPEGVKINKELFKQATFINHSVENVKEALRDGAILVAIILFIFLLNFRTTIITLTAIPLSFAITAIVFSFFGLEINTMTLGGLAIAIGLLVDDAIVDVENVYRRLKANNQKPNSEPTLKVVYDASKEVRNSIIFATLIVILAFLPLFFMSGLGGRFFEPLGIAFIVSLIASMIVSLTVTPVLCSYLLPKLESLKNVEDVKFVKMLKELDAVVVNKVLARPNLIIIPTIIIFVGSLLLFPKFNKEFLPKFNEGTAMVSVILPPGVSLEYSNKQGLIAENIIKNIPEVKHVSRRTGRAELDEHAEGVNTSEIDVDFYAGKGRARKEVLNVIREKLLKAIPTASINLGQPISHRLDHMLSGVNAQIALKIFGPDRDQLKILATQVYSAISKVEGLVDTQIEKQVEIPQIKSYFIREDAQKYNINIGVISDQLQIALQGENVAQVINDQRVINVFSRLNDQSRSTVENLQNIIVKVMPSGEKVTLSMIADVYKATGPNVINRENMQRRIIVQANTHNRGLDRVIADIKNKINKNINFPEGYYILYDGQFKSQQESSKIMVITGALAIVGIFILLFGHFKSAFITFQIMLSIPLAVIGSIIAVYLTDKTVSIATIVAFIALCGIASRNGILMISHYLHLMAEEGEKFSKEMVLRGSLERLVPVLMTTISAMLGLVPLLLSKGAPGKEILYPVATVIVGGLFSSTILDMWVTPAIFYRFGKKSALKYLDQLKDKKESL
jgi:CzcA family heavy metal efflux pump